MLVGDAPAVSGPRGERRLPSGPAEHAPGLRGDEELVPSVRRTRAAGEHRPPCATARRPYPGRGGSRRGDLEGSGMDTPGRLSGNSRDLVRGPAGRDVQATAGPPRRWDHSAVWEAVWEWTFGARRTLGAGGRGVRRRRGDTPRAAPEAGLRLAPRHFRSDAARELGTGAPRPRAAGPPSVRNVGSHAVGSGPPTAAVAFKHPTQFHRPKPPRPPTRQSGRTRRAGPLTFCPGPRNDGNGRCPRTRNHEPARRPPSVHTYELLGSVFSHVLDHCSSLPAFPRPWDFLAAPRTASGRSPTRAGPWPP